LQSTKRGGIRKACFTTTPLYPETKKIRSFTTFVTCVLELNNRLRRQEVYFGENEAMFSKLGSGSIILRDLSHLAGPRPPVQRPPRSCFRHGRSSLMECCFWCLLLITKLRTVQTLWFVLEQALPWVKGDKHDPGVVKIMMDGHMLHAKTGIL